MLNGRKPALLLKLAAVEVVRGHLRDGALVAPYLRERDPKASSHRAKGIPDRRAMTVVPTRSKRETWQLSVQDHHAHRAGRHFDLRLGDPKTQVVHSWAIPKSKLPAPGEKLLAVAQPKHTWEYMDFSGHITEGYGKGRVDMHKRSTVEVLYSAADRVRFNLYKGREISEYVLIQTDDKRWLIQNITPVRTPGLPSSKPKYRIVDPDRLVPDNPEQVIQAKIDGAHVLVEMKPGKQTRVFSYRPTERATGIIDHTWRYEKVIGHKAAAGTGHTILRGELYASKGGEALPAAEVGGLLNAGVQRSREKQAVQGKLDLVVFDVVKHRGQDAEFLPYSEKLAILAEQTSRHSAVMSLPATAFTPPAKKELLRSVKAGDHPETKEGFIVWDLNRPGPAKAKIRDDHDVYVRGVFRAYGKGGSGLDRAGGFFFSWDPDGPIQGRVGTGFDHKTLREMLSFPERYVGRVAKVLSPERFPSGALRAPAFSEWHLDKGAE